MQHLLINQGVLLQKPKEQIQVNLQSINNQWIDVNSAIHQANGRAISGVNWHNSGVMEKALKVWIREWSLRLFQPPVKRWKAVLWISL